MKNKRSKRVFSIEGTQSVGITEAGHLFFREFNDDEYIVFHDRRKIIVLNDKGSKTSYRLVNDMEKDLVAYHVDGGVLKGTDSSKCDYALYSEDDILILVELKGADYGHAMEQIESTFNSLIRSKGIVVKRIYGRVVLTKARIPNFRSTAEIRLKKLFMMFGGSFEKQTSVLEDVYSRL